MDDAWVKKCAYVQCVAILWLLLRIYDGFVGWRLAPLMAKMITACTLIKRNKRRDDFVLCSPFLLCSAYLLPLAIFCNFMIASGPFVLIESGCCRCRRARVSCVQCKNTAMRARAAFFIQRASLYTAKKLHHEKVLKVCCCCFPFLVHLFIACIGASLQKNRYSPNEYLYGYVVWPYAMCT